LSIAETIELISKRKSAITEQPESIDGLLKPLGIIKMLGQPLSPVMIHIQGVGIEIILFDNAALLEFPLQIVLHPVRRFGDIFPDAISDAGPTAVHLVLSKEVPEVEEEFSSFQTAGLERPGGGGGQEEALCRV